jgi:hypothetical protein
LILDSHGSYSILEFDQFCLDNYIVILYIPSYLLHLLQLLDIACFGLLKTAYSKLVQQLVYNCIFHIDKTDFLANYQQARGAIYSKQNILSRFCATGLLLFNPSRVLSTLTITKIPSLPTSSHGQFSSL